MIYKGGHKAGKGSYWNLRTGQRVDLPIGGTLPGKDAYCARPLGGVYTVALGIIAFTAITLPAIGPATVLIMWMVPVIGVMIGMAALAGKASFKVGEAMAFGWRPIAAYFAGRKRTKKDRK